MTEPDLEAVARAIVDSNLYLTLATADSSGRPWASPVYFAHAGYSDFLWISSPEAAHSRNIAVRPEVSLVIFDSQVPAYSGQAVYAAATARQLSGADLDWGLTIYPGPAERGARRLTAAELTGPSPYRLYCATASEHWTICPRPAGQPCSDHGLAYDHRTPVSPSDS